MSCYPQEAPCRELLLLFFLQAAIVCCVCCRDITLRYKEIRRQKQEHRHEKDKCLSNGDGHSALLDEPNGNKLRERKL